MIDVVTAVVVIESLPDRTHRRAAAPKDRALWKEICRMRGGSAFHVLPADNSGFGPRHF
jgi:hypothetical protein